MDPALSQKVSGFFELLENVAIVTIGVPLLLLLSVIGFVFYAFWREEIRPQTRTPQALFALELSRYTYSSIAQQSAVYSIKQKFAHLVKCASNNSWGDLTLERLETAINEVRTLCQTHKLSEKIVDHFIDSCLHLTNTAQHNNIRLVLATKYSK